MRELLEHGYDTAALTALTRDFTAWQIEHVDPGSTWAAISRDHHPAQMITASDLDADDRGAAGEAVPRLGRARPIPVPRSASMGLFRHGDAS